MRDMDKLLRNLVKRNTPSHHKLAKIQTTIQREDFTENPRIALDWVARIYACAFSEMNRENVS